MIKWEDIFNIVEDKDSNGKPIFRLKFKHDSSDVRKGFMSTSKLTCERHAWRWVSDSKNEKKAVEMLFELNVLNI